MKIIRGINRIKKMKRPVVALGVFDGVHRGHRNILKAAVRKARSIDGTSVVLTFWPHPQKKESLYSLEHRLKLIEALGIDVCIVVNFNQRFAAMPAVDFIRGILYEKIGVQYVYIGKNFRFGRKAEGDFNTLLSLARYFAFKPKAIEIIKTKNTQISSTYIRSLIKKGDLIGSQKLLERPVSILGTVIKGKSLASKWGFSTANINPHHEVIPPSGIYAVRVIYNAKKYNGICYIGSKPTIIKTKDQRPKTKDQTCLPDRQGPKTKDQMSVEVHIFNFNQNIYGKNLEIQFIKKVRNEQKFSSRELLVRQIKKDISLVKNRLSLR